MVETGTYRQAPLGPRRITVVAAAIGLSVLLVVAAALEPDTRGHGTHEHLGLPPCAFSVLVGRPCPVCGMTTSWAWLVRGRVAEAFRANVGGAMLAAAAMVAAPWLLLSALRGRWLPWTPNSTALGWAGAAVLAVTLLQWAWRWLTIWR
ncbi:MAG: DUF2752 domain-containing protein [Thermoguttaceae bacterium]